VGHPALYRPFARTHLYFDRILNEEVYTLSSLFPDRASEQQNRVVAVTGPGSEKPFMIMATGCLLDFHLSGAGCGTQCFPFYIYDEDSSNRRENITDWALNEFRAHYNDSNISKWDIFHYVYAVLHHPEYRERYAANLKRELPRIPFVGADAGSVLEGAGLQASAQPTAERHKETAGPSTRAEALGRDDNVVGDAGRGAEVPLYPDAKSVGLNRGPSTPLRSAQDDTQVFWRFVEAGRQLAELHVNYEQQTPYPLERVEKG
jgi:predicted helicase